MTTLTPRASINSGAWQYGGIDGLSVSDSVQLGRDPTDGIKAERYEIYGYPPAFTVPSGWTDVNGTYRHLGGSPDAFTLTYWGDYLIRVVATLDSGEEVEDRTLALRILSPAGFRDIPPGAEAQFGGWAVDLQYNIRLWDTATNGQVPIGGVFIAVVDTDPATLLGYGTWSAIGAGRVLVGQDTGDADYDTLEETGGSKSHTHTTPAHQHELPFGLDGNYIAIAASATGSAGGAYGSRWSYQTTGGSSYTLYETENDGSGTSGSTDNPMAYIVVKVWKRTA